MALDFFAGCMGGCAGVLVGHPFDTVKVRLQTQDYKNPKYRGTLHCFSSILKAEGPKGLLKGMSSPLAGVAVINAVLFGAHGNIVRRMEDPDSLRAQVIAGSSAGFIQSWIASPMELVKTRMQIQSEISGAVVKSFSGHKKNAVATYTSSIDCVRKIFASEGIRGIFRGQKITIMREIPAFGTYFYTYESMTRACTSRGIEPSTGVILVSGGMAGIASWSITYPVDLIKSRLQIDGMNGPSQYRGIVDCFVKSYKREGLSAFTRGFTSTILRAFPTNAATFAVYSWTMRMLAHEDAGSDLDDLQEVLHGAQTLMTTARNVLDNSPSLQLTNLSQFKLKLSSPLDLSVNFSSQSKLPVDLKKRIFNLVDDGHFEENDEDDDHSSNFFAQSGQDFREITNSVMEMVGGMRKYAFNSQVKRSIEQFFVHMITLTM